MRGIWPTVKDGFGGMSWMKDGFERTRSAGNNIVNEVDQWDNQLLLPKILSEESWLRPGRETETVVATSLGYYSSQDKECMDKVASGRFDSLYLQNYLRSSWHTFNQVLKHSWDFGSYWWLVCKGDQLDWDQMIGGPMSRVDSLSCSRWSVTCEYPAQSSHRRWFTVIVNGWTWASQFHVPSQQQGLVFCCSPSSPGFQRQSFTIPSCNQWLFDILLPFHQDQSALLQHQHHFHPHNCLT